MQHDNILKELKYATRKNSIITYVFDVLIEFLLEIICRLLVACDETRKCNFTDRINVKTSKNMKIAKCDVSVGAKFKIPNIVHA